MLLLQQRGLSLRCKKNFEDILRNQKVKGRVLFSFTGRTLFYCQPLFLTCPYVKFGFLQASPSHKYTLAQLCSVNNVLLGSLTLTSIKSHSKITFYLHQFLYFRFESREFPKMSHDQNLVFFLIIFFLNMIYVEIFVLYNILLTILTLNLNINNLFCVIW